MSDKKEFDESQKEAISVNTNAVVSAGAGSGKTSVLSQRFTYLVTQKKYKVDEILTLTFTKKATVEMYGRIYKSLKEASPSAVEEFYKAKIQTLDSYCASVAKMGAHLYGIQPDFTEDDDSITDTISAEALPFILKHRDNKALQNLVQTKEYATIAQELFVNPVINYSSITNPIDYEKEMEAQRAEVIEEWNATSQKTLSLFDELKQIFEDTEANKDTEFAKNLATALEKEISEPPVISEEDILSGNWKNLESFCIDINRFANISKSGTNNKNWVPVKDLIDKFKKINEILVSIANYVYGYQTTSAVVPLLEEFQDEAIETKRSTGILTFKDTSELALKILTEHPEIRAIEKSKYKAILIDEFQDNNSMQRDMLFLLAEKKERMEKSIPSVEELVPNKLFFVGDEKQSIYRFRGADVSVFRSLKNSFPNGNIELKTNYRSHPALIAAFNTIFGGISYPLSEKHDDALPSLFYTENNIANQNTIPNYEAVYNEVLVPKDKIGSIENESAQNGKNTAYKARVHFAFVKTEKRKKGAPKIINPNELEEDETEAYWVAQKIKSLIAGEDGKPPVKPSDIAILLRKYTRQPVFERMLLQAGVPYNCTVIKGFFSDGPVNDLFAFLRLCIYPNDTMAYATLLRSPFINLNQAETESVLLIQNKNSDIKNIKTDLFSDEQKSVLSEDSAKRFEETKKLYNEITTFVKTAPIAEVVSKLWYELGYRYETIWNTKVEMYTTLYDRVFELARQADENSTGLASFVDDMRTYENQNKKLDGMDIPLEHGDSVNLLTIFRSKGLEYSVVFICGTESISKEEKNVEAVYFSKKYGVSINTPPIASISDKKTNYFFEKIKAEESSMNSAELRRIVYVALTRAINEVYITGKSSFDFSKGNDYLPGGNTNPSTIHTTLLPILNYYTDENGIASGPITLEEIERIQRNTLYETTAQKTRRNTPKDKNILIDAASPLYENATSITKDIVKSPYRSPSQLHKADDETSRTTIFTASDEIPFSEINNIVESTRPKKIKSEDSTSELPEPKFDYTNFGTIAHAYLEAAIKKTTPDISARDIVGLDGSEKKKKEIFEICQKMADTFIQSELGKEASESTWHKAEYEFRSKVDDYIIKGSIDLVFKNKDGGYTIVDYKTNQTVEPSIYYAQLACYREAVSSMLGCVAEKIKCHLYYLRFGKNVDITSNCNKINIAEAIKIADGEN